MSWALGARRLAFLVMLAAAPVATGALIAVLDANGTSLLIAPEIWMAATIALMAVVWRSRRPYGRAASVMGAVGSGLLYGVVLFPLFTAVACVAVADHWVV